MAKAGDTTFSIDTITLEADGTCRVRLDAQLLGKNNVAVPLARETVVVPLPEPLASQAATLYASIVGLAQTALPPNLAGATPAPTSARAEQRAARQAAREAAREAARAALPGERPSRI